jgi:hypothetical protein
MKRVTFPRPGAFRRSPVLELVGMRCNAPLTFGKLLVIALPN